MDEFLKELAELLEKHRATILRSANSTHDLVVSIHDGNGYFDEIKFEEEINESDIKYKRYSAC
jgi:hypothetical protein